jgi:hypothetical protein
MMNALSGVKQKEAQLGLLDINGKHSNYKL